MLEKNLLLVISLIMLVAMLSMLSNKLKVSYPIFLVLAGLVISMLPKGFHVELDSDLVFIIFLPPLLFEAAWNNSWKELVQYKTSVLRLALGLVFFTSLAVAFTANMIIPGFTLALGFLLGGIISPPDAVAATSVLSGLKIPNRVKATLEGESLINDASSLVVFRFALAAVLSGQFVFWKAGASFFYIALMGIAVGLGIAFLVYLFLRFLPTTPSIDTTITFIFPYLAYLTAEHFGFSGVLSVVFGGLLLNSQSSKFLSYNTRLQMTSVWEMVVFLMNGAIFILIGLQLPDIVSGLGTTTFKEAVIITLVISLVAVLARFIWIYPINTMFDTIRRKLFKKKFAISLSKADWKSQFIIAWSGMRGVVSLASGLAIPMIAPNNTLFPFRNLILFITFGVILFTLVIQGLSLPLIIKWLAIPSTENNSQLFNNLTLDMAKETVAYIKDHYQKQVEHSESFKTVLNTYENYIDSIEEEKVVTEEAELNQYMSTYKKMLLEIINLKRSMLYKYRIEDTYPEFIIRRKERELDLDEARLDKGDRH